MVLPSSGDNPEFFCPDTGRWTPIDQMRFEEARIYRWRTSYREPFQFYVFGMPIPMVQTKTGWEGEWTAPFQSGMLTFTFEHAERITLESQLFPDKRKITEADYLQMIADILAEATVCFQHCGANLKFDSNGFARKTSLAQWDYIDRSFYRLQQWFRDIQARPLRRLTTTDQWIRRENVKHVTPALLAWSERHPGNGITQELPVPELVWSGVREDTYSVYENRVLLRQLRELQHLLREYQAVNLEVIRSKAGYYLDRVNGWLRSSFLQQLQSHAGPVVVSQVFRKHPVYRNWFSWFQQLNQFNEYSIGLQSSIPLKDTFHLYEIWVFMQLVKILRENGSLLDSSDIFSLEQDGLVLKLSEKKESQIKLVGGATLGYQRRFKSSTRDYATYTHDMIPDIVLEVRGKLYIFDPKYRIDRNLPMALGEMHKYRDGIVRSIDGSRAVEEVYIITPADGKENSILFSNDYMQKHHMGVYTLKPGNGNMRLALKLTDIMRESLEQ